MRKAVLYRKLDKERVECVACARRCKLSPGQVGFCGIRGNYNGDLYLLSYGILIAINVDPIEKKPLTHFHPGSKVLSIATTGCNWACAYCQNYDISQRRHIEGFELEPEEVVKIALETGSDGITYTYNEPTIFMEYAHDVGVIARKEGLFNTFVTNGYMTDEAVDYLSEFLDAATVDIKGNADNNFARKFIQIINYEPVFETLKELKRKKIFIEITDLVIPKVGDDLDKARKLARWIVENLGPETPVHFLRFHPDYKMLDYPPTPVKTLEQHVKIAREEGLKYVYVGNVPGHPLENTYCPNCGKPVIVRYGFEILEWHLDQENRCRYCGYKINIVGTLKRNYNPYRSRFIFVPVRDKKYVSIDPSELVREGLRSKISLENIDKGVI
ncbi:MAG: AmmeMemoRadiSam system radical SAM enzyme [Desulfurococcales archaeon]|jgi:pyruvate formate lyase activating enzyme|nr:AmmeMemoRadiSam system radical SAM enzyme [Desulfurococcales archaeon]